MTMPENSRFKNFAALEAPQERIRLAILGERTVSNPMLPFAAAAYMLLEPSDMLQNLSRDRIISELINTLMASKYSGDASALHQFADAFAGISRAGLGHVHHRIALAILEEQTRQNDPLNHKTPYDYPTRRQILDQARVSFTGDDGAANMYTLYRLLKIVPIRVANAPRGRKQSQHQQYQNNTTRFSPEVIANIVRLHCKALVTDHFR